VELVVGLSVTSAAVRVVVLEGATGEGDTVDHDVVDIAAVRTAVRAAEPQDALLRNRVIEFARNNTLRSIGVTWTADAAADGSTVLETLAASGFGNFLAVSECDAVEALATTEQPEAALLFGSDDDLDLILPLPCSDGPSLVVSAGDADLALARGAALAAARAMSGLVVQVAPAPVAEDDPRHRRRRTSRVEVLTSVLAGAALTFVVSLSLAVGLHLTAHSNPAGSEPRDAATASDQPAMGAIPPPAAQGWPEPPQFDPAPPPAAAPTPEQAAASAPAPEVAPANEPELPAAPVTPPLVYGPTEAAPAAPPPAPADVPPTPAPAAEVPPLTIPQRQPPQPRLRDRIIEKIPILNRFHDPAPQYP
jgi:hypothetical protein